jgi:hypothetical protein
MNNFEPILNNKNNNFINKEINVKQNKIDYDTIKTMIMNKNKHVQEIKEIEKPTKKNSRKPKHNLHIGIEI